MCCDSFRYVFFCITFLTMATAAAASEDFTGTYKGHQILITIAADSGNYAGTIQMQGANYPFTGILEKGVLSGKFKVDGDDFDFTARISGSMLSFDTDGTTYILQRQEGQSAPKNPLARENAQQPRQEQQRPQNPLDRGTQRQDQPQAQPGAGASGSNSELMKFTRLSVKDPGINNLEAVSFLIPAGWRAEGGIQWFPDYAILANLLMRISDPQTGATIEFLPMQNFTHLTNPVVPMQRGTNYMGCIVWEPIGDVPTFVQTFYAPQTLRHLQGARVVANEELRSVANEVARSLGGQPQVVASRVRYAFQANGQPWEEDVYVTLVFTNWQMGTFWSVHSAYSMRAPQGMLDRMTPLMNTTIRTMRLSLDWYGGYMYVQSLFAQRMKEGIKGAMDISNTITRNSEEIRQMFSESYRKANESQDRISQSFSEYIRGVDTYHNPFEERPIQLPGGYRDAWVNNKGEYLLSNQAGFDPNVGDTSEWRRMDRRGD